MKTDNTNSLGGDGPNGLGRRRAAASGEQQQQQKYRITEFIISPYTVAHTWDGGQNTGWKEGAKLETCDAGVAGKGVSDNQRPLILGESDAARVLYTYDVEWFKSEVSWASRWDVYLGDEAAHGDVHWFNILNALLVVVFLTGVLGIIMARTVRFEFLSLSLSLGLGLGLGFERWNLRESGCVPRALLTAPSPRRLHLQREHSPQSPCFTTQRTHLT